MAKLGKYFDKIEEVLGVSVLFVMLVILSYQIVLRFIFKASNAWSEELARYLFVWFVYLTASMAILKNAHIRIDALLKVYPGGMRRAVVLVGYAAFFVYCVAITCYSTLFTMQIVDAEQISLGLEMPMWLVWISLPLCHAMMAIRILQRMYHIIFLGESYASVDLELENN